MTKELCFDSWHGQKTFLYSKASRQALGPTQSLLSRTFALLSPAKSGWNMKFSIYFKLVLGMKIRGAITSLPTYALMVCTETKVLLPAIFIVYTSLQAFIQITC